MIIQRGIISNTVVEGTPTERAWLNDYLSFDLHAAKFSEAYKSGTWDGKVRLYSVDTGRFPAGLLPLVRKGAEKVHYPLDVVDGRGPHVLADPTKTADWLDPKRDQPATLAACLREGQGVISAPTGCLTGDTKINVTRGGVSFNVELAYLVAQLSGRVPLEKLWDLRVPTMVRSVTLEGAVVLNKIEAVHDNDLHKVFKVRTTGHEICATGAHRFLTLGGKYERLRDLTQGRMVAIVPWPQGDGVIWDRVLSIRPVGMRRVYDLTMAAPLHNYVANGFAVHNSGKSELLVALALIVPARWLILVPSIDLLHQQAARFELRLKQKPGILGDGLWIKGSGDVGSRTVVATFQTLYRGIKVKNKKTLEFLNTIEGVCYDEVHVLAAESFLLVSKKLINAWWRLGFSGTPLARQDQRTAYLIGATGPVIHKVDIHQLIAAGVLAQPTIHFVPCQQTVPGFDWATVYENGIVNSIPRNTLLTQIAKRAKKPALLFIKNMSHGRHMLKRLLDAGIKCTFVKGSSTSWERQTAIKRLESGSIELLLASTIFDQGVDIPAIESVILGGGGKSEIRALQRLGRGTRVTENKSSVEIWDVADTGNRWLASHAGARQAAYVAAGHRVVIEPPIV